MVSAEAEVPVLKQLSKTAFIYEGGISLPPELLSLVLALSLYTSTFVAECVRAGIQGISKGKKEVCICGFKFKTNFKISSYATSFKNYYTTNYKSVFKPDKKFILVTRHCLPRPSSSFCWYRIDANW